MDQYVAGIVILAILLVIVIPKILIEDNDNNDHWMH